MAVPEELLLSSLDLLYEQALAADARRDVASPVDASRDGGVTPHSAHLARAQHLRARLLAARDHVAACAEALDRVDQGVVLLDGNGRCRAMNHAARAVTAAGDGLEVARGELRPASSHALAELRASIRAAVAADGSATASAVSLPRPSGKTPYVVLLAPRPRQRPQDMAFAPGPVAALAFIIDPEIGPAADPATLAAAFNLTPAQVTVAVHLAGGDTLAGIAARTRVSPHTVRSHVQALFHKTGTRRQADLVRLLRAVLTVR